MMVLAASIVRFWVRLYTVGLETTVRERIIQEVESDLWEQMNSKDADKKPAGEAMLMIFRWILGIPADVQRAIEESGSGGRSMWTKNIFGVVAQRRTWLNLFILSGVSFSLLFFGIGTFIAAVFVIVIPGVLLASPFIALWPGASFGPISLAGVWQSLLLFLIGLAMLVVQLHLAKLVSSRLHLMARDTGERKKHTGLVYHMFGVLHDRRAWSSLLFILLVMLSLIFLGIGTFTAAITLAVITGAFIANPFIYPNHDVRIGPVLIDNPIESALLVIAGLGLGLLILHLSNLVVGSIGERIISRFRRPEVQLSQI